MSYCHLVEKIERQILIARIIILVYCSKAILQEAVIYAYGQFKPNLKPLVSSNNGGHKSLWPYAILLNSYIMDLLARIDFGSKI